MIRRLGCVFILLALMLTSVRTVAAQELGAIAGVVRDSSGAVLPGVTVEVTSPALIEKLRTAVTGDSGQYRVVSLPTGVYTVTFTLSGFTTQRRQGIEARVNFTASVNADLSIGTLEETVTVTGESPLVDVQSAVSAQELTATTWREIPSGGSWMQMASLIPGVIYSGQNGPSAPDVGGSTGTPVGVGVTAHGGRHHDQVSMLDGINIGNVAQAGNLAAQTLSPLLFEEVNIQTAGQGADAASLGVTVNAIPRSGGNVFSGSFLANGSSPNLQASNFTDRLRERGLVGQAASIRRLYDINGALGGPVVRDRLWFFGTARRNVASSNLAGGYYAVDPTAIQRVDDLSEPLHTLETVTDGTFRLTGMLTGKQKLTSFLHIQDKCACFWSVNTASSPESIQKTIWPIHMYQAAWTYTPTSRLLFEAGGNYSDTSYTILPQSFAILPPEPGGVYRTVEQGGTLSRPVTYGAPGVSNAARLIQQAWRATVTYATGSHSFKAGMDGRSGFRTLEAFHVGGGIQYRTRNFVPNQLTLLSPVQWSTARLNYNYGVYVQDRWTMNRLTLTPGVRLEFLKGTAEALHAGPDRWLPNRNDFYPAVENAPNWKEINPRFGASYDLFGNGRTALKASAGRGVQQDTINTALALSPASTLVTQVQRNWNDTNSNFVPDCDLRNPEQNGECGQWLNRAFGSPVPGTTWDPELLEGWGVRPWNWEFTGGVSHQLVPRLSLDVTYFRRVRGNFRVTQNTLVTPSDYTPYSVRVPNDPRLPNSGQTITGLHDIDPTLVSAVRNRVTKAENFGKQQEHYNGLDVIADARLRNGLFAQGGVSIGKTMTDECEVRRNMNDPTQWRCRVETGLEPQFKGMMAYELPYSVRVSGTFQSISGPVLAANVIYTGAEIAQALGRPFSTGANGQAIVNIFPGDGAQYGDRLYQIDMRVTRIIRIGRTTIDAQFDIYNLLNSDTILFETVTYGQSWRNPASVLQPRMVKFGVRVDF